MKRFFIIFFFAVIIASPTDLKSLLGISLYLHFQKNVYGGYSECSEYIYEYNSGNIDSSTKKLERKIKYDEKGNMVEENFYDDDGKISFTYYNIYDDKGKLIEKYHEYPNGFKSFHEIHKFDSQGNEIEASHSYDGISYSKEKNKFDDKGNIIEWVYFDSKDKIISKITYRYDEKEKLINKNRNWEDGRIDDYNYSYKYDNDGNILEETWRQFNYHFLKKITNKYDEKGRKIEEIEYEYMRTKTNTFKYDEKGKIIEKTFFDNDNKMYHQEKYKYSDSIMIYEETAYYHNDNMHDFKFVYKYNEKGNYTEASNYHSDGTIPVRYTYKYDNFGNQIEKIVYHGNKPFKKYVYEFSK